MGRKGYLGAIKGEPVNTAAANDAIIMKEWIKKAKKLRKGRCMTYTGADHRPNGR